MDIHSIDDTLETSSTTSLSSSSSYSDIPLSFIFDAQGLKETSSAWFHWERGEGKVFEIVDGPKSKHKTLACCDASIDSIQYIDILDDISFNSTLSESSWFISKSKRNKTK